MTCAEARLDLGVFVVGALEPAERAALDEHLAGCAGCRDELSQLAGLPGLLSRLHPDEAASGPPHPSDGLYQELLGRVVDARRVRRRRRLVAVAAGLALLAAGGAAAGVALSGGPAATSITVVDRHTGVQGRFQLTAFDSGTQISLLLSHVPPEEHCELVAVSRGGDREVAASWVATYRGYATVRGTTGIPLGQLSELVVQTDDGGMLLTLPVHD